MNSYFARGWPFLEIMEHNALFTKLWRLEATVSQVENSVQTVENLIVMRHHDDGCLLLGRYFGQTA